LKDIKDSIAYCNNIISFICKKKGISGDLLDELHSIGYLGLAKALNTYKKEKGSLKSYIYHKIKFEIDDYIRIQLGKNSKKKQIEHESLHFQYIENYNIFIDIYNKVEAKDLVYKILSKMSPKRTKILHYYFFQDMTLLQIAKKFKCTQSNIHYHYKKALTELRKELCGEYDYATADSDR
jgi:RNA polymerase sigma factor (sigma-70 family)